MFRATRYLITSSATMPFTPPSGSASAVSRPARSMSITSGGTLACANREHNLDNNSTLQLHAEAVSDVPLSIPDGQPAAPLRDYCKLRLNLSVSNLKPVAGTWCKSSGGMVPWHLWSGSSRPSTGANVFRSPGANAAR